MKNNLPKILADRGIQHKIMILSEVLHEGDSEKIVKACRRFDSYLKKFSNETGEAYLNYIKIWGEVQAIKHAAILKQGKSCKKEFSNLIKIFQKT